MDVKQKRGGPATQRQAVRCREITGVGAPVPRDGWEAPDGMGVCAATLVYHSADNCTALFVPVATDAGGEGLLSTHCRRSRFYRLGRFNDRIKPRPWTERPPTTDRNRCSAAVQLSVVNDSNGVGSSRAARPIALRLGPTADLGHKGDPHVFVCSDAAIPALGRPAKEFVVQAACSLAFDAMQKHVAARSHRCHSWMWLLWVENECENVA